MRGFFCFFLVAFLVLCSVRAGASHSAGGELLYEWVSDSTYRIIMKLYRDCAGVEVASSRRVCYTNECDYYRESVILFLKNPDGKELYPGCPDYPTKCSDPNSIYPGYEEYIYEGYVTLPSRCKKWKFFVNEVARNKNIGNLVNSIYYNPPNHPMYLEATLNNEDAQGNSSPVFSVMPVPYVCVHKPYTFNNGTVDKDGDYLVYDHVQPTWGLFQTGLDTCFYARTIEIPYCCGYRMPDNPFSTNFTYRLDSLTGHISFTPQQVQTAVVTLRVREFRNGVEIGSVMRDIQLSIIPCTAPDIVTSVDTAGASGVLMGTDRVEGCMETPLEVCVDFRVPDDPGARLAITDNHGLALPGAVVSYTNLNTDSVRACVRWTPSAADTGLHVLVFLMKDSSCRPPGKLVTSAFTLPFQINRDTRAEGTADICPGDSVRLAVTGWPDFTWDVLPGGSPASTLSCTQCTDPWASPAVTTSYIVTADNRVCRRHTDTVTVTVLPAPQIQIMQDTITCINNTLQLHVDIDRRPGEQYTIAWTPSATLSDPSVQSPVAQPVRDIIYRVSVSGRTNECISRDSLRVEVLQGFTLHTGDTAVCEGQSFAVALTGDPRYGYVWSPADGVSDVQLREPVITPPASGSYTVTASYPGCRDSVASFTVEVQPYPVVRLPGDTILCRNDTMRLVPSVQPFYRDYRYEWTPADNFISGSAVSSPVFRADRSTDVRLLVATPAGCSGNDNMFIEVAGHAQVLPDTGICPGDTVRLSVSGNSSGQVWRPAMWISDTLSAAPLVYPEQTITYTVYTLDTMNCRDTQRVTVHVYPEARIELPDSIMVYEGEVRYMDPGGNCLYFEWLPPEGLSDPLAANPRVYPAEYTQYTVTGITEHGCATSDTIRVYTSEALFDIPNAFLPGSPGNGIFRAAFRGGVRLNYFHVFNRWGEKVFTTKDITEGWDGTLRGRPQPSGVYVYVIEAFGPGGKLFYRQGNVTLIR